MKVVENKLQELDLREKDLIQREELLNAQSDELINKEKKIAE